jgi:hypothetical protein
MCIIIIILLFFWFIYFFHSVINSTMEKVHFNDVVCPHVFPITNSNAQSMCEKVF